MEKENKKRIEELRGEQIRLQAQCYLLKIALETNEQQLARIGAAIGEHEAGGSRTAPTEGEEQSPADTARRIPTEGEEDEK